MPSVEIETLPNGGTFTCGTSRLKLVEPKSTVRAIVTLTTAAR